MYLARYAVECALKAHAIDRLRKTTWQEVVQHPFRPRLGLRGAAGHSLTALLTAASIDIAKDPHIHRRWQLLSPSVVSHLRYAKEERGRGEAKAFVEAATEVHDWILSQPRV
jgi:hypothetical protein